MRNKLLDNLINRLRNNTPSGRRQTSWLYCASVAKDLNNLQKCPAASHSGTSVQAKLAVNMLELSSLLRQLVL